IDGIYRPIVIGRNLIFASSLTDCVIVLDTRTGRERWRFYANGPIRYAPAGWNNRIYVGSDDGYLYSLSLHDGQLLWKFRGGPSNRKVIGHDRLISAWPISGGPVVTEGRIWFAAGIWPFEGVFIYCLDSATGNVIWVNDGTGARYSEQPHAGAEAFSGPTPQGYLAIAGDRLLVPCGRAIPACFDRRTGKLLYFHAATYKSTLPDDGPGVCAAPPYFFYGRLALSLADGMPAFTLRSHPLWQEGIAFDTSGAYDLNKIRTTDVGPVAFLVWRMPQQGLTLGICAGRTVYGWSTNRIVAIEFHDRGGAKTVWQTEVNGSPSDMVAGDDKLFVVTREGTIYCYGTGPVEPPEPRYSQPPASQPPTAGAKTSEVNALVAAASKEGYVIVMGADDPTLVEGLMSKCGRRVDIIEPRHEFAEKLRRSWDGPVSDSYGRRVALIEDEPSSCALPPYIAGLMVCPNTSLLAPRNTDSSNPMKAVGDVVSRLFETIRPYGGALCIRPFGPGEQSVSEIEAWALSVKPTSATVSTAGQFAVFRRDGPLPGAADWTHTAVDAANTYSSQDDLVRAPLGVLWFGGFAGSAFYFDRHLRPVSPLVLDGRLIVQGTNALHAFDVYTGRLLWREPLPEPPVRWLPTFSGYEMAAATNGVYLIIGDRCACYEPNSGKKIGEFDLPAQPRDPKIVRDRLVITSRDGVGVFDRYSGRALWFRQIPDATPVDTAVGRDMLFSLESCAPRVGAVWSGAQSRLCTLDLTKGCPLWQKELKIPATCIAYSETYDTVLIAHRFGGTARTPLLALRASDGSRIWETRVPQAGPPIVLRDSVILQNGNVLDLRTGRPKMHPDPFTGVDSPVRFTRAYGCNYAVASRNIVTFRSGTAGFYDWSTHGG
ncbi:MAG: PQQ-binding-like beta-propeller repeat protein, partial [Kiritimatiellae bacterium]|nr:PQQ-binding-like beta-propeller repeat protein [Kiritimatiellia bacterium]